MTHTRWIFVLAMLSLVLFLRGCQESNAHAVLKFEAQQSAEKVALLTSEIETITASNDSLRNAIAETDSVLAFNTEQWVIERRTLSRRAVAASTNREQFHAALTALGDSTVSALADSLQASHKAIVDSYEAQIETYEAENEALRVSMGQLRLFAGGLETELETQRQINMEQQVQIDIFQKLANPPWHEKLKRAIPSVGVGASVAVIGLVALGAL